MKVMGSYDLGLLVGALQSTNAPYKMPKKLCRSRGNPATKFVLASRMAKFA